MKGSVLGQMMAKNNNVRVKGFFLAFSHMIIMMIKRERERERLKKTSRHSLVILAERG